MVVSPEAAAEQLQDINLICGFYTKTITQAFSSKVDMLNRLGVSVRPYLFEFHLMMYPERRFSYDFISQMRDSIGWRRNFLISCQEIH